MIHNRITIKKYTSIRKGHIPVKRTIYERIRELFKGRRYICFIHTRCTSIDKALKLVRNIGEQNILSAEWFDGNAKSVDIIVRGKVTDNTALVGYVNKKIFRVISLKHK